MITQFSHYHTSTFPPLSPVISTTATAASSFTTTAAATASVVTTIATTLVSMSMLIPSFPPVTHITLTTYEIWIQIPFR